MSTQRIKLSKKLFMSLKPGQYMMSNNIPLAYEEICENLENQWENWKPLNGNTVTIFDSQEECLREWWSLNSGSKLLKSQNRAIQEGKLSKKIFMAQPDGYVLFFTQAPFEYYELSSAREDQWLECRHQNGLHTRIYKCLTDCILDRDGYL